MDECEHDFITQLTPAHGKINNKRSFSVKNKLQEHENIDNEKLSILASNLLLVHLFFTQFVFLFSNFSYCCCV